MCVCKAIIWGIYFLLLFGFSALAGFDKLLTFIVFVPTSIFTALVVLVVCGKFPPCRYGGWYY